MEKSEQKQRPEHTPSASFKARTEPPPKTSGSTGVGGLTFMRLPRGGLVSIARNHFLVIYYLFGNILIYRKEESVMLRYTAPLILLFVSNIFMTYAWWRSSSVGASHFLNTAFRCRRTASGTPSIRCLSSKSCRRSLRWPSSQVFHSL